jgi:hypothetical protein
MIRAFLAGAVRHKRAIKASPPIPAYRCSNPLELKRFLSVLRPRFDAYYTPQKTFLNFFELISPNFSIFK